MNKQFLQVLMIFSGIFFMNACRYDHVQDVKGAFPVQVSLQLKAGSSNFTLNTDFQNSFGETYRIQKYLFYVSNIEMLYPAGSTKVQDNDGYHLIDAAKPASQVLNFSAPYNRATGIRFLVGVDSLRNVSGAQTGALDPLNGMFWTWSSGYIMAMMEGSSPQSTQPFNQIIYHIGGFSGSKNATRWVTLNFPAGTAMDVNAGGRCEIVIEADINKWFNGVSNIKIADFAYTMSPGGTAMALADNYAKMFQITNLINR